MLQQTGYVLNSVKTASSVWSPLSLLRYRPLCWRCSLETWLDLTDTCGFKHYNRKQNHMQRMAALGLICCNLITQRSVYKCPYCNREGLVFNLYWICFCDFNPHLAAFVIAGIKNVLPQGYSLSLPPVKDHKEVKLTHFPAWGLPF